MWPVLLWGPVCQKNPEAEFYLRKEVSGTEGLEASRYVEDGYLYTIPKLALRGGLVWSSVVVSAILVILSSLKRAVRVRSAKEPVVW